LLIIAMPVISLEKRYWGAARDVKLGMGVRPAARKWDVSRTTLQRRLDGIPTRKETNRNLQSLSPYLEAQMVYWAVGQARLGYAPSLVKFRSIANAMLSSTGALKKVSYTWHCCFLDRNPAVKTARSHKISYLRVNGATAANIHLFFDRLDAPEVSAIPIDHWYNADEMGVGQGVGGDHWVICEIASRLALKKDIDKGEWITVLECISGDGYALPPLLIFKGKHVQQQWFPRRNLGLWDDWSFKASPKGWTSNEIALDWLEGIFIPHIRRRHGNKWVVLVCDGHDSHTNETFLATCMLNKVWLVFYEPHCSHVVQALDVGVFGLLKKRLRKYLCDSPCMALGITPSKEDVMKALRLARLDVLLPEVIKKAWATAGIYPRDRSKPLSSKYVMLEKEGVAKAKPAAPAAGARPKTPEFSVFDPKYVMETPSTGQDLRRSCRKFATDYSAFNMPAQRLVTRKASKALDRQAEKIAFLEAKVQYLQAKVSRSVPKKRKKVKPAPGRKFAMMADVRRVKRRMRRRVIYEDEASDCEVPGTVESLVAAIAEDESEIEDCITIPTA
jgi:hypothetical protein